MGFEYDFEASDKAWVMRHVRSDELEAFAQGGMPGSQQRRCALKRGNVGKDHDPNTRIAQVPVHLLGSPQLERRQELSM
jgi:hypothetical protein